MATMAERLQELLDLRDDELEKEREQREKLERELEESADGWRISEEFEDDGMLPVPRLEFVYRQIDEWRSYRVTYRLVMRHFLGQMIGIPLGATKIGGGLNKKPETGHTPFRDGVHAMHDSGLFGCPVYRVMPGEAPEKITWPDDRQSAIHEGRAHRRS